MFGSGFICNESSVIEAVLLKLASVSLTWMAWWVVWITELGLLFTNKTLLTGCMFPVAVWMTDCWFGWITEDCAWVCKRRFIITITKQTFWWRLFSRIYLMSVCILLRYQLNDVRGRHWRDAGSLVRRWRIQRINGSILLDAIHLRLRFWRWHDCTTLKLLGKNCRVLK